MKGHFEAEAIGYSIERDQRAGGRLAAAVSDLIGLDRNPMGEGIPARSYGTSVVLHESGG